MTARRADAPARRPGPAARRFGYALAILVNAAILYAVNVWPGWQILPFLTGEFRQLLDLVNLSLIAGMVANLIFLIFDVPWVKALGDLVVTVIGLAVMVRFWQVFPFDFADTTLDWALITRVVLIVAMAGTAIAILVQLVVLVRSIVAIGRHPEQRADDRPRQ
jgi:hypothetical protein